MTLYLMAIVLFALSLSPFTSYLQIANQIKCQKFDLENEGQDQEEEKLDLHHLTGNVRFYISAFFRIIANRNMRLCKR